jgi:hypothetical protein
VSQYSKYVIPLPSIAGMTYEGSNDVTRSYWKVFDSSPEVATCTHASSTVQLSADRAEMSAHGIALFSSYCNTAVS